MFFVWKIFKNGDNYFFNQRGPLYPLMLFFPRNFFLILGFQTASVDHVGGLTATYYKTATNIPHITTCGDNPWTSEISTVFDTCGGGPWAADFSFGTAPSFFPASLSGQAWDARWMGFIRPSFSGVHRFVLSAGSGGGQTGSITMGGVTQSSSLDIILSENEVYDITLTLTGASGAGTNFFSVAWYRPVANMVPRPIPTSRLHPLVAIDKISFTPSVSGLLQTTIAGAVAYGLDATMYDQDNFQNPVSTRVDQKVEFSLGAWIDYTTSVRSTTSLKLSDSQSFSIRWAGLIEPASAAATTFKVRY